PTASRLSPQRRERRRRQGRRGGVHQRRGAVVHLDGRRPAGQRGERASLDQQLGEIEIGGIGGGRDDHRQVRRRGSRDPERRGALETPFLPTGNGEGGRRDPPGNP